MQSLKDFITKNRLLITKCVSISRNPNVPDWKDAYHYEVTISKGVARKWDTPLLDKDAESYIVYFSKGLGHSTYYASMDYRKPTFPTLSEILDCLALDAAGIENAQGFEDWCSEYGYDPDSQKAERIFRLCEKEAERLEDFLGDEAYQELLWETERE